MQLRAAELQRHLAGPLAPAYVISGDEPLLVQEACDAVLGAARDNGFGERSVLYAEGSFDWSDLAQDAASLSLFAERRVIDVRVPAGKLDAQAAEVLKRYAADPNPDTLLLIRMARIEGKSRSSAWYKALDQLGAMVAIWPIDPKDLPRWLDGRLKRAGLTLDRDALALFTERVEGNLLAAVQEIRTLELADLPSPVSAQALQDVLEDSARYDAFELIDATLVGDAPRVTRMLATLRQEGVALFAIMGAVTFTLRQIAGNKYLPPPRKKLVPMLLERIGSAAALERVLAECALVDAQGKGQIPGDAWLSLEDLLLRLAGVRAFRSGPAHRHLRVT